MSYDLLVFDKRRPPTNQSDFLDWYNQRVEEEDEGDISCVSEEMQIFFHSVRQIFPPMNVKQNQILSKAAAERLFLEFFQNLETNGSIKWVEMDI